MGPIISSRPVIVSRSFISILLLLRMSSSCNLDLVLSDGEWISPAEFRFRRGLSFAFRLALGTFCSAQLWDFMFNPIWMHGYLWSLNQAYSLADSNGGSLADKSALAILEHQMTLVGPWERAGHALLGTLATWLLLYCAGFGRSDCTVWRLMALSMCAGAMAGLNRAIQQRQRLYPCIHECFFAFLLIFSNGLCLCLRWPISRGRHKDEGTEQELAKKKEA